MRRVVPPHSDQRLIPIPIDHADASPVYLPRRLGHRDIFKLVNRQPTQHVYLLLPLRFHPVFHRVHAGKFVVPNVIIAAIIMKISAATYRLTSHLSIEATLAISGIGSAFQDGMTDLTEQTPDHV